jgi:hypothetical protein
MPDPIIDKSYLNRTVNKTARPRQAMPGDGTIRFIGCHETENPAYRRSPTAVLEYGLVSGPVQGRRGSANWYVDFWGGLHHFVLEERYIAWHAGTSVWRGVRNLALSAASIGIEVDLPGGGVPPSPAQWTTLLWLVRNLAAYWRIPLDLAHLWEHKAVALPPGRKHDPSAFSAAQVLAALATPTGDPL